MNQKRQNEKAISRSEMKDVVNSIKCKWNVPREKLIDALERCRALAVDPEAYERDKGKAKTTIAVIEGALSNDA